MRWSVKERHDLGSVERLHAGVLTVVQRFRSDLGLYVHLHCLVTDGVFEELEEHGNGVRFLPAATPTPEQVVTDPDDIARILHGPRAPPRPPRPHLQARWVLFAC